MRRIVIAVLVVGLVLGATRVRELRAQDEHDTALHAEQQRAPEDESPAASLGWGMAAVGTNIGYIPAKMLYALTGGLVGLLAWGVTLGNSDVALGVLQPALGGTWVVTPEMLRGDAPIMLVGASYEPPEDR